MRRRGGVGGSGGGDGGSDDGGGDDDGGDGGGGESRFLTLSLMRLPESAVKAHFRMKHYIPNMRSLQALDMKWPYDIEQNLGVSGEGKIQKRASKTACHQNSFWVDFGKTVNPCNLQKRASGTSAVLIYTFWPVRFLLLPRAKQVTTSSPTCNSKVDQHASKTPF